MSGSQSTNAVYKRLFLFQLGFFLGRELFLEDDQLLVPVAELAFPLFGLFAVCELLTDIGNGTMNTLYLVNGKPQSGKMFTEKFGTYQCTLAIREGFMRKTRRELNDYIIDEVLRTGTAGIPDSSLYPLNSPYP